MRTADDDAAVLLWEILTRKPVPFPGKDEETVKALVKAGVRPVITPEEEASAPPGFVDVPPSFYSVLLPRMLRCSKIVVGSFWMLMWPAADQGLLGAEA